MNLLSTRRLIPLVAPAFALAFIAAGGAAVSASAPPTSSPDGAPTGSEPIETEPVDTVPIVLPDGFVWLVDDTGVITVAVPEAWTAVDTAPAEDLEGNPQPWIAVAPSSIDDFLATFDEPGVLFSAVTFDPDPAFLIEQFSLVEECDEFSVEPYDERGLVGLTQIGSDCGDNGTASWQLIIANPADQSFTALVQIQTVSEDDVAAAELALDSFTTTGVPMVTPDSSIPGSAQPPPSTPATTEADG